MRRHILLDGIEEVSELRGAVSLLSQADDLAGPRIECGEQAGGAVGLVVVGAALDLSGAMGNSGAVRSSACICDFSSTHSASARSGGARYKPTMSRIFSINSGSRESLKISVRWARGRRRARCG